MTDRNVAPGDKYTVEALVALYEFQPELRDVFVEGRSDAGFVRWYLRERGLSPLVRAVDDVVWISSGRVAALHQAINARGRAVALAHALQADTYSAQRATVLVDADWTRAVGPQLPSGVETLVVSDMPAIENYCFLERPLQKLLDSVLHTDSVDAGALINMSRKPLTQLHAARIVLFGLQTRLARNPMALLRAEQQEIEFDTTEFLRRSHSCSRETAEALALEAEWYYLALETSGQGSYGHDIAPFLIVQLDLSGHLADSTTLEAAMRGCVEASDLDGWPAFERLKERVAA